MRPSRFLCGKDKFDFPKKSAMRIAKLCHFEGFPAVEFEIKCSYILIRFYEEWGYDAITTSALPAAGSRLAIALADRLENCMELAGFFDNATETEIAVSFSL